MQVQLNLIGTQKEIQKVLAILNQTDWTPTEDIMTKGQADATYGTAGTGGNGGSAGIPIITATKKKAKASEKEEQQSFDLDTPIDQPETMTTEDDFGVEETAPMVTQLDVVKALQAYAKKHSREKAIKVLSKFKVKTAKDLHESQYRDVVKALS